MLSAVLLIKFVPLFECLVVCRPSLYPWFVFAPECRLHVCFGVLLLQRTSASTHHLINKHLQSWCVSAVLWTAGQKCQLALCLPINFVFHSLHYASFILKLGCTSLGIITALLLWGMNWTSLLCSCPFILGAHFVSCFYVYIFRHFTGGFTLRIPWIKDWWFCCSVKVSPFPSCLWNQWCLSGLD